jgi:ABC-2 type transport system permease protein
VIAQVRAELLKVRSTRTTLGLLLGMVALILLFSLLTALLSHADAISSTEDQRQLLSIGDLSGLFSALAGVLLVTSEYRYGTIRPTFLFTPRRPQVLVAKLAAGLLAGLVFGVIGEGLGFLLLLGTFAGTALWGAMGVGLGAILRNQVGAVITLLAWGFVVDNLLFGLVPSVGRFTPTRAQDGLIGLTTEHLLSPVAAGLVLLAWVVLLAVIGLPLITRRDVT